MMKRILTGMMAILALTGCSSANILNATIPRKGYSVKYDIAYGTEDRQKLDIYIPDGLAAPAPVIVFYYGGSWQMGSKGDYRFLGQALASKGFVTVVADYRLYPKVYFPTFVEDGAQAFNWVHGHIGEYGGDANNMYLAGHSAGGYIAVMLGVNESYLKAAGADPMWVRGTIGIAGPYDFLPFDDDKIRALFSKKPDAETQPIYYVHHKVAPMMLVTGADDDTVLPRNTKNIAKKLEEKHSDVEVHIYPDTAHIGIILSLANGFRGRTPLLEDIASFVARTKK